MPPHPAHVGWGGDVSENENAELVFPYRASRKELKLRPLRVYPV